MHTVLEPKTFSENLMKMDGISAKTQEEHMKLYQGYVKKYNEIMQKLEALTDEDYTNANQIYSLLRSLKTDLTFAIGGVKNHEIYFGHLGGQGGRPEGELLEMITKCFGSYEKWEQDLKATAIAARGWVWLAWDNDLGHLFNYLGDAQNTFPVWNSTPILALDTYEHAYFIDHGAARAKYVEAFMKNLDWKAVEKNWEMAVGCVCEDGEEGCACGGNCGCGGHEEK
ncbi:MAG: Fe-Mn family superoxide dismutase [bacterium]|nr:Fe-Mn family superoxide dismutase [bacterium]